MNPDVIRQRKVDRQTVLAACYRICDGSTDKGFNVDVVVKVTGLARDRASSAISYLCDAGLIRQFTVVYYLLTPAGVDAVEDAIQQDDSGGEASPFIQQAFHGPVGVVQNAASGTAHVEMSTESSPRLVKMVQPIHFEDFSGEQFERLVLAYHLRIEPKTNWEWYGQVGGDLGRDIWGERQDGTSVCVQCVNRGALTFDKGSGDLDKAVGGPKGKPSVFRIVCRSTVSADMRDRLKKHAEGLGVPTCDIWAGADFEERLRRDSEALLKRFVAGEAFPDSPDALAGGWPPESARTIEGTGRSPVSLTLDYKTVSMTPLPYPTEHRYCLTARTSNTGGSRLDDWYLEVEMPTAILLGHEKSLGAYVRERSNEKRSFFRPPGPMHPLVCGDHFDFSLNYRVDNDIYYKSRVFEQSVVFRVFVNGSLAAEVSKLVDELQNF